MTQPEVRQTFDGDCVIHGGHFSLSESDIIMLDQGYRDETEHVSEVAYKWVTWGRLPEELCEDGYTHGWWFVDPTKRKYGHLKKVTCIINMK